MPLRSPVRDALIWLVVVAGCGAILVFAVDVGAGIPPRAQLQEVTGTLAWLKRHKSGPRFALAEEPRAFIYSTKAGEANAVHDALQAAGATPVTLLYNPVDPMGPVYSDEDYYTVWELQVRGRTVRTYAETSQAWRSNDQLAPWLGGALMALGLFVAVQKWRQPGR